MSRRERVNGRVKGGRIWSIYLYENKTMKPH
jgi:hypothetical protein